MSIKDRYVWKAIKPDGAVVDSGGDLSGCQSVVFEPAEGVRLPKHEFSGIEFESRFCRVMLKTHFNIRDELPGVIYWENGSMEQKTSEDLTAHIKRGDFVGKGVDGDDWYLVAEVFSDRLKLLTAYNGKSKPKGFRGIKIDIQKTGKSECYLHCLVCKDFKIWVDYQDGSVRITDKSQDIYL